MHFVQPSVRPSVRNILCELYNLRTHLWITIYFGTNVVLIVTMCSDLDSDPYLKGQGHTKHLMVRVHMLVSVLQPTYALMDFHLTWYKCCP